MMMQVYNSQPGPLEVGNLTFKCLPRYANANVGHVVVDEMIPETIAAGDTTDVQVILQARASPEIYQCKVSTVGATNVTTNLKLTIK
ncbi:hypothetical protein KY321_05605, partial [Candidatus Woesearchaeota archaeon]|nr:hypothetical protein [Candidatus Woesearchaeota archaeon]